MRDVEPWRAIVKGDGRDARLQLLRVTVFGLLYRRSHGSDIAIGWCRFDCGKQERYSCLGLQGALEVEMLQYHEI